MKFNMTMRVLPKTVFVLIMTMAAGFACGTDAAAAAAKSIKMPATQHEAKMDPAEWKKVLEAAKKEGKIVIAGMPGEEWRKSLVDMFHQEYPEITVDFSTTLGRNLLPRIRQERGMGKKLWDLLLGGPNTAMETKKDGFLTPIRPVLLPEIADDSKWFGGIDGTFSDREEKYIFCYIRYTTASGQVNRDFIKESDLKSSAQLLDQKFRSKIVIQTPTFGATLQALGAMASMYGTDFIRELLSKQDVMVTDDNRQQVEWVVRGKYPISIGLVPELLIPYVKQGLGKNVVKLEYKMGRTTSGNGSMSLLEGAPHPNAARVYINWLLSQKTQSMLSQNVQLNSGRADVPVFDKRTAIDPAKKYYNSAKEENSDFAASLIPMINEALKK